MGVIFGSGWGDWKKLFIEPKIMLLVLGPFPIKEDFVVTVLLSTWYTNN